MAPTFFYEDPPFGLSFCQSLKFLTTSLFFFIIILILTSNPMSIPINDILRVAPGNDHIQFRCDIHRLSRSRKHPMYILDTPSRLQGTPTLHIIGASGNDYELHVTPTSISCSCPDQHQACKHMLFILHQTMSVFAKAKI